MLPNPTLDQLQVFVAVADKGSFSAAARQLNRAQSVVSYTIANLETQLQLQLFDRQARQPVLTEAGRAMLEDARRIVADLDSLRARSRALTEGLEGEVGLAVSVMVPDHVLTDVLADFQREFPTVLLRLVVGTPFLVSRSLASGSAALAIGGRTDPVEERLNGERIGLSYLAPAAAPGHRLARLSRRLDISDVRDEVQIVTADVVDGNEGPDLNVFSRRTWRVGDMATKRQLLLGGLGWGGLPLSMIRDDIAEGRLVALDVEGYDIRDYPIMAQWHAATPPGPAARWIVRALANSLAGCPQSSDAALLGLEEPGRTARLDPIRHTG